MGTKVKTDSSLIPPDSIVPQFDKEKFSKYSVDWWPHKIYQLVFICNYCSKYLDRRRIKGFLRRGKVRGTTKFCLKCKSRGFSVEMKWRMA